MRANNESSKIEFFEIELPSNNFRHNTNPNFNPTHNSKLLSATITDGFQYAKVSKVASLFKKPMCKYQSKLLRESLSNGQTFTLRCDKLDLRLCLKPADIRRVLDPANGILRVRTSKQKELLMVQPQQLKEANKASNRDNDVPFFTQKYRLTLVDNPEAFIDIFIADPANENNATKQLEYNCKICMIPTRFEGYAGLENSMHLLQRAFKHLNSVFNTRRYSQIFTNAMIDAVDLCIDMHGVSQAFLVPLTVDQRARKTTTYPLNMSCAKETCYIGSMRENHLAIYDKLLQTIKSLFEKALENKQDLVDRVFELMPQLRDWVNQFGCRSRAESRWKTGAKDKMDVLGLSELDHCPDQLTNLCFIDPEHLHQLPKRVIEGYLKSKTRKAGLALLDKLKKITGKSDDELLIKVDAELYASHKQNLIGLLKKAILEPTDELFQAEPIAAFHYSRAEAIKDIQEFFKPYYKAERIHHDEAEDIAKAPLEHVYVEGVPGAGKTYLLMLRLREMEQRGVSMRNVCLLSYTNAVVKNFKMKLPKFIKDELAVHSSTFSAFSHLLLKEYFPNHSLQLAPEQCEQYLKDVVSSKINSKNKHGSSKRLVSLDELKQLISQMNGHEIASVKMCIKQFMPHLLEHSKKVAKLIGKYRSLKSENDVMDYDDLFSMLKSHLIESPETAKTIVARFSHMLLDEVQDTNLAQFAVIECLADAGMTFFCVGDPAQSIYQFRGANFKKARLKKSLPHIHFYRMTKNHRSTNSITKLSNFVRKSISHNLQNATTDNPEGQLPKVLERNSLDEVIEWLAEEMQGVKKKTLVCCRYNEVVDKINDKVKSKLSKKLRKKVKATTGHSAKGLEAKLTIVIDPRFTSSMYGTDKEEMNALYVSMTRAQEELIIIRSTLARPFGKNGSWKGGFILDNLPEELYEAIY